MAIRRGRYEMLRFIGYRVPTAKSSKRASTSRIGKPSHANLVAARGPYDLVYERYSLWSYAAIEDAAARGTATVLEVNAPLIEEQAEHRGLVNRSLAEDVARRVFNAAGAVVAVSEEVAAYVRSHVSDAGRVHVIPNGVDPSRFVAQHKRDDDDDDDGRFTIGFVGTMKPWHGVPVLIDTFERLHRAHPQMHLLLVGDGKEKQTFADDIAARGLAGTLTMTGAVERDAIPTLLASMDVAVAPYPKLETILFFAAQGAGIPGRRRSGCRKRHRSAFEPHRARADGAARAARRCWGACWRDRAVVRRCGPAATTGNCRSRARAG
jgi:glycosyltransferase involved in cell wall biosynthesis